MSLKLPTVKVRVRAIAGGAVLGGALLIGMALVGGVGDPPGSSSEPPPERLGPATAIQPELREALLTDQDLPPVAQADHDDHDDDDRGDRDAPRAERPAHSAARGTEPPAARVPAAEAGAVAELCRALFEDPAGLAGLWQIPPAEITSSHTKRPGGATLHQVLGVFKGGRAAEVYQRMRESTSACNRFETTLRDGSPVTFLLEELTAPRAEPESATADDSYSMLISLEDGELAGWLTVDRVGPIVSVLRQLGPSEIYDYDDSYEELALARTAALDKLRPLLRTLRGAR